MKAESGLLTELIEALRVLPGVGPKSAQRMAFHLLERDRDAGRRLASAMAAAMAHVGRCRSCRTLTEAPLCEICANPKRDSSLVCVVENPPDMAAIEQATDYAGGYFVLGGRLSPLDGIGPDELELEHLERRLASGEVRELILAISATIEGSATSQYLADMAAGHRVLVTRIAQGVPLGGELEFVDGDTLAHAFSGRRPL